MISCARIMVSTAWRKASTSNWPSGPTYFIRFNDERLQAESSRNMYSEQGFEALIRAVFGQGCQSLTVVSNCIPGSPQTHAESAILRIISRDLYVSMICCGGVTARVCHSPSFSYERMNSSVTR